MRKIDGENIIYHYIQKHILPQEDGFSYTLLKRLLIDLSIWLPPYMYTRIPILLPYVIRDSSCRLSVNKRKEEWGSPDKKGFFRDDNSLIKSVPRTFRIKSALNEYNGRSLGRGFVACHIWRAKKNSSKLVSQIPQFYSFVPNLVWLPKQIAKLTDREASFPQKFLQYMSYSLYCNFLRNNDVIADIWNNLDRPSDFTDSIKTEKLNFFIAPDEWITKRRKKLCSHLNILSNHESILRQKRMKIHSSRYLEGLKKLKPQQLKELNQWSEEYLDLLTQLH